MVSDFGSQALLADFGFWTLVADFGSQALLADFGFWTLVADFEFRTLVSPVNYEQFSYFIANPFFSLSFLTKRHSAFQDISSFLNNSGIVFRSLLASQNLDISQFKIGKDWNSIVTVKSAHLDIVCGFASFKGQQPQKMGPKKQYRIIEKS